jgi:hypothetical protein
MTKARYDGLADWYDAVLGNAERRDYPKLVAVQLRR